MQYPIENLYNYIIDTLHPPSVHEHNPAITGGQAEQKITRLIAEAKLALCTHFAFAASPKQAKLLLHSLQVALGDLEDAVNGYIAQIPANDAIVMAFYVGVLNRLQELRKHLEKNFYNARLFEKSQLATAVKEEQATGPGNGKWSTNLSVPQLALFMRLLVESGILSDVTSISRLTHSIAGLLHTKRMMPLSPESLRIKYYQPESAAIGILKDYLVKMMSLLRDYNK